MLLSRYAAARILALTCLLAAACGGTPPPVTQPTPTVKPPSALDPAAARMGATPLPAEKPIPTGAITGRITGGVPAAPLPRARVILTTETLPEPRVTIAGQDGSYRFEKLPPGNYGILATASNYAPQLYAQRRTTAPPPIVLADAQQLTGIDVDLPPAGVIIGQVLDEDQRPFVGASVDALASRMDNNQSTLVTMATATTDDRGEFRLTGLPEGQYYVSAFDPAFSDVGDETGPLRYAATYYPGVVLVEQATRVSVRPGVASDLKINFTLKIIRPARVAGLIATPDKKQLMSGAVIMTAVHGEGLATVPSQDVQINPDGTFVFRNVAPGLYQIRARAEVDPEGIALFATYRTLVNGRDISNVDLVLLPGATIAGTVSFEPVQNPKPVTFAGLRVRAPFADGSNFGDVLTGDVTLEGTYRIRGLMSGIHYMTVQGLEGPWVLKEILSRGQDITDVQLDVENKQVIEDIRIVLTDAANDVSGTVRDARGRPVPESLVVLLPLAPNFWTPTSRRFALRYADEQGRYRVRGLPAGEYRAIASVELDESEIYRKELLTEFFERGTPFTLAERQTRTLDLTLTSLAKLKRTSTR
ncbi:MAG TPA: carboxypeptidase-like regulatory domain-containing protein [Vicinamibacterales bacterium]|nr:carboxypeptidase-like regulatory domain-containing protein [Vicinamibacterales bacterium]